MNSGFYEIEDCRVFRKNAIQWEIESCFRFSYYVYVVLVVSAVAVTILFFMLWCLCCALRSDGGDAPKPEKPPVVYNEPNVDIDDKEKLPGY
jgi:hypothetical protein